MKRRLLIIGGGGHASVVGDCASAMDAWSEVLFFDDRWPSVQQCGPWPITGKCNQVIASAREGDEVFVGIGDNALRLDYLQRLRAEQRQIAMIVHPGATVSRMASLEDGVLVVAGATINVGAQVGFGAIINTGCSIDHDCRLEEGVHVSPGARLAGNVNVGQLSWLGIGSVVTQGVTIGRGVTVGAASLVLKDVEDGLTVVGLPAKPIGESK